MSGHNLAGVGDCATHFSAGATSVVQPLVVLFPALAARAHLREFKTLLSPGLLSKQDFQKKTNGAELGLMGQ